VTLVDMDRVSALLRQATAEAIVPRFRRLGSDEVEEKSPGEVVTVADREAEAIISQGLQEFMPGVPVIGEEAVAADPSLLDALQAEPVVWLVDPLDGTSNFTRGEEYWATMVALVRSGETVAAWMLRADGALFTAERHEGAYRDGERLNSRRSPGERSPEDLRGAVLTRFLTDDERTWMSPGLSHLGEVTSGYSCTGFEYPAIVEGEEDFALFQRLLPWDHAPGCLVLTEAGGVAAHPDGTPFRPDHAERRGLLVARDLETWSVVRDLLYPALASSAVG
jgi:fructose-1,6-bisphosphatase/inositol monophosphatase family enzyme